MAPVLQSRKSRYPVDKLCLKFLWHVYPLYITLINPTISYLRDPRQLKVVRFLRQGQLLTPFGAKVTSYLWPMFCKVGAKDSIGKNALFKGISKIITRGKSS